MSLVPNGRMRVQEKQSLLRNGNFSFAQAEDPKQQNAQQQPKVDPRVQIEQQQIGNGGQQPAGGQNHQQAAPAPATSATPGEASPEGEQTPAANMDVMQDRVDGAAEDQASSPMMPGEGSIEQEEKDMGSELARFYQKFGWPPRVLQEYSENIVDEHNAPGADGGILKEFTIKLPNRYFGKNGSGAINDKDFTELVNFVSHHWKLRWTGANRKGKTLVMQFTSEMAQNVGHPAEQQAAEIYGKKPGQGSSGGGGGAMPKAKAASTLGEMIKGRRDDLFETMRKIAQGSK